MEGYRIPRCPPGDYCIPKVKRNGTDGLLTPVRPGSREEQDVIKIVRRSFLNESFSSQYAVEKICLVNNEELQKDFSSKRQEMKEHGRDVTERYLFTTSGGTDNFPKGKTAVPSQGRSVLGDSTKGVYLKKNADVCLRCQAAKFQRKRTRLLIYKVMLGRVLAVAHDSRSDPNPNHDCHVSREPPRLTDKYWEQYLKTQVYLYEYSDEGLPVKRPRQVLPYAALTLIDVTEVDEQGSQPTVHRIIEGFPMLEPVAPDRRKSVEHVCQKTATANPSPLSSQTKCEVWKKKRAVLKGRQAPTAAVTNPKEDGTHNQVHSTSGTKTATNKSATNPKQDGAGHKIHSSSKTATNHKRVTPPKQSKVNSTSRTESSANHKKNVCLSSIKERKHDSMKTKGHLFVKPDRKMSLKEKRKKVKTAPATKETHTKQSNAVMDIMDIMDRVKDPKLARRRKPVDFMYNQSSADVSPKAASLEKKKSNDSRNKQKEGLFLKQPSEVDDIKMRSAVVVLEHIDHHSVVCNGSRNSPVGERRKSTSSESSGVSEEFLTLDIWTGSGDEEDSMKSTSHSPETSQDSWTGNANEVDNNPTEISAAEANLRGSGTIDKESCQSADTAEDREEVSLSDTLTVKSLDVLVPRFFTTLESERASPRESESIDVETSQCVDTSEDREEVTVTRAMKSFNVQASVPFTMTESERSSPREPGSIDKEFHQSADTTEDREEVSDSQADEKLPDVQVPGPINSAESERASSRESESIDVETNQSADTFEGREEASKRAGPRESEAIDNETHQCGCTYEGSKDVSVTQTVRSPDAQVSVPFTTRESKRAGPRESESIDVETNQSGDTSEDWKKLSDTQTSDTHTSLDVLVSGPFPTAGFDRPSLREVKGPSSTHSLTHPRRISDFAEDEESEVDNDSVLDHGLDFIEGLGRSLDLVDIRSLNGEDGSSDETEQEMDSLPEQEDDMQELPHDQEVDICTSPAVSADVDNVTEHDGMDDCSAMREFTSKEEKNAGSCRDVPQVDTANRDVALGENCDSTSKEGIDFTMQVEEVWGGSSISYCALDIDVFSLDAELPEQLVGELSFLQQDDNYEQPAIDYTLPFTSQESHRGGDELREEAGELEVKVKGKDVDSEDATVSNCDPAATTDSRQLSVGEKDDLLLSQDADSSLARSPSGSEDSVERQDHPEEKCKDEDHKCNEKTISVKEEPMEFSIDSKLLNVKKEEKQLKLKLEQDHTEEKYKDKEDTSNEEISVKMEHMEYSVDSKLLKLKEEEKQLKLKLEQLQDERKRFEAETGKASVEFSKHKSSHNVDSESDCPVSYSDQGTDMIGEGRKGQSAQQDVRESNKAVSAECMKEEGEEKPPDTKGVPFSEPVDNPVCTSTSSTSRDSVSSDQSAVNQQSMSVSEGVPKTDDTGETLNSPDHKNEEKVSNEDATSNSSKRDHNLNIVTIVPTAGENVETGKCSTPKDESKFPAEGKISLTDRLRQVRCPELSLPLDTMQTPDEMLPTVKEKSPLIQPDAAASSSKDGTKVYRLVDVCQNPTNKILTKMGLKKLDRKVSKEQWKEKRQFFKAVAQSQKPDTKSVGQALYNSRQVHQSSIDQKQTEGKVKSCAVNIQDRKSGNNGETCSSEKPASDSSNVESLLIQDAEVQRQWDNWRRQNKKKSKRWKESKKLERKLKHQSRSAHPFICKSRTWKNRHPNSRTVENKVKPREDRQKMLARGENRTQHPPQKVLERKEPNYSTERTGHGQKRKSDASVSPDHLGSKLKRRRHEIKSTLTKREKVAATNVKTCGEPAKTKQRVNKDSSSASSSTQKDKKTDTTANAKGRSSVCKVQNSKSSTSTVSSSRPMSQARVFNGKVHVSQVRSGESNIGATQLRAEVSNDKKSEEETEQVKAGMSQLRAEVKKGMVLESQKETGQVQDSSVCPTSSAKAESTKREKVASAKVKTHGEPAKTELRVNKDTCSSSASAQKDNKTDTTSRTNGRSSVLNVQGSGSSMLPSSRPMPSTQARDVNGKVEVSSDKKSQEETVQVKTGISQSRAEVKKDKVSESQKETGQVQDSSICPTSSAKAELTKREKVASTKVKTHGEPAKTELRVNKDRSSASGQNAQEDNKTDTTANAKGRSLVCKVQNSKSPTSVVSSSRPMSSTQADKVPESQERSGDGKTGATQPTTKVSSAKKSQEEAGSIQPRAEINNDKMSESQKETVQVKDDTIRPTSGANEELFTGKSSPEGTEEVKTSSVILKQLYREMQVKLKDVTTAAERESILLAMKVLKESGGPEMKDVKSEDSTECTTCEAEPSQEALCTTDIGEQCTIQHGDDLSKETSALSKDFIQTDSEPPEEGAGLHQALCITGFQEQCTMHDGNDLRKEETSTLSKESIQTDSEPPEEAAGLHQALCIHVTGFQEQCTMHDGNDLSKDETSALSKRSVQPDSSLQSSEAHYATVPTAVHGSQSTEHGKDDCDPVDTDTSVEDNVSKPCQDDYESVDMDISEENQPEEISTPVITEDLSNPHQQDNYLLVDMDTSTEETKPHAEDNYTLIDMDTSMEGVQEVPESPEKLQEGVPYSPTWNGFSDDHQEELKRTLEVRLDATLLFQPIGCKSSDRSELEKAAQRETPPIDETASFLLSKPPISTKMLLQGAETPLLETQGIETPLAETPLDTPLAEMQTPLAEEQSVETPLMETENDDHHQEELMKTVAARSDANVFQPIGCRGDDLSESEKGADRKTPPIDETASFLSKPPDFLVESISDPHLSIKALLSPPSNRHASVSQPTIMGTDGHLTTLSLKIPSPGNSPHSLESQHATTMEKKSLNSPPVFHEHKLIRPKRLPSGKDVYFKPINIPLECKGILKDPRTKANSVNTIDLEALHWKSYPSPAKRLRRKSAPQTLPASTPLTSPNTGLPTHPPASNDVRDVESTALLVQTVGQQLIRSLQNSLTLRNQSGALQPQFPPAVTSNPNYQDLRSRNVTCISSNVCRDPRIRKRRQSEPNNIRSSGDESTIVEVRSKILQDLRDQLSKLNKRCGAPLENGCEEQEQPDGETKEHGVEQTASFSSFSSCSTMSVSEKCGRLTGGSGDSSESAQSKVHDADISGKSPDIPACGNMNAEGEQLNTKAKDSDQHADAALKEGEIVSKEEAKGLSRKEKKRMRMKMRKRKKEREKDISSKRQKYDDPKPCPAMVKGSSCTSSGDLQSRGLPSKPYLYSSPKHSESSDKTSCRAEPSACDCSSAVEDKISSIHTTQGEDGSEDAETLAEELSNQQEDRKKYGEPRSNEHGTVEQPIPARCGEPSPTNDINALEEGNMLDDAHMGQNNELNVQQDTGAVSEQSATGSHAASMVPDCPSLNFRADPLLTTREREGQGLNQNETLIYHQQRLEELVKQHNTLSSMARRNDSSTLKDRLNSLERKMLEEKVCIYSLRCLYVFQKRRNIDKICEQASFVEQKILFWRKKLGKMKKRSEKLSSPEPEIAPLERKLEDLYEQRTELLMSWHRERLFKIEKMSAQALKNTLDHLIIIQRDWERKDNNQLMMIHLKKVIKKAKIALKLKEEDAGNSRPGMPCHDGSCDLEKGPSSQAETVQEREGGALVSSCTLQTQGAKENETNPSPGLSLSSIGPGTSDCMMSNAPCGDEKENPPSLEDGVAKESQFAADGPRPNCHTPDSLEVQKSCATSDDEALMDSTPMTPATPVCDEPQETVKSLNIQQDTSAVSEQSENGGLANPSETDSQHASMMPDCPSLNFRADPLLTTREREGQCLNQKELIVYYQQRLVELNKQQDTLSSIAPNIDSGTLKDSMNSLEKEMLEAKVIIYSMRCLYIFERRRGHVYKYLSNKASSVEKKIQQLKTRLRLREIEKRSRKLPSPEPETIQMERELEDLYEQRTEAFTSFFRERAFGIDTMSAQALKNTLNHLLTIQQDWEEKNTNQLIMTLLEKVIKKAEIALELKEEDAGNWRPDTPCQDESCDPEQGPSSQAETAPIEDSGATVPICALQAQQGAKENETNLSSGASPSRIDTDTSDCTVTSTPCRDEKENPPSLEDGVSKESQFAADGPRPNCRTPDSLEVQKASATSDDEALMDSTPTTPGTPVCDEPQEPVTWDGKFYAVILPTQPVVEEPQAKVTSIQSEHGSSDSKSSKPDDCDTDAESTAPPPQLETHVPKQQEAQVETDEETSSAAPEVNTTNESSPTAEEGTEEEGRRSEDWNSSVSSEEQRTNDTRRRRTSFRQWRRAERWKARMEEQSNYQGNQGSFINRFHCNQAGGQYNQANMLSRQANSMCNQANMQSRQANSMCNQANMLGRQGNSMCNQQNWDSRTCVRTGNTYQQCTNQAMNIPSLCQVGRFGNNIPSLCQLGRLGNNMPWSRRGDMCNNMSDRMDMRRQYITNRNQQWNMCQSNFQRGYNNQRY
ncbi:uncharacterized protein LOC118412121 isoform X2 [Branchiostoma floridae]|uniref:Uncharacterized protein LOC118412121 isoform X2 n=1 Tax=Branchiostoma floridae TaxID=7739 RepID=A0A9J7KVQ0_BRAFL|nr:uncharacterized protein LOC118412121 isoform X2 [Branchiostoma floridae]